jgi:hypothetical protein
MRFLFYLPIVFILSCGPAQKQKKQGATFFYYPKTNIYYDIEQKEYYLYDSAISAWKMQEQSPAADSLGKKVLIEHASVPVYKDNEQHRLIYGTALYSSASDVRRKYIEDSLNSLPPPVAPRDTTTEKKDRKKGFFRRLWDKIFK